MTLKARYVITITIWSQGWGVRAGEAISRGTFVCEYIGEVLDEQEARNRRERFTFLSRYNFI